MNEQEQFIALAKWEGWTDLGIDPSAMMGQTYGLHPERKLKPAPIPNYNSLDVLRECEKRLTNAQRRAYVASLVNVHPLHYDPTLPSDDKWMHIYFLVSTTAAQRREALLKTLGLWKEETE